MAAAAVAEAWSLLAFVAPAATSPASPHRGTRSSGDDGDSCCCCLFLSVLGVAPHDVDPPPRSSSSSVLTTGLSLWLFAPLRFPNRDRTRAAPIALRQRARGLTICLPFIH